MKRIWSPWRSLHLREFEGRHTAPGGRGSIFSRIAAENRDEENFILWRGTAIFVVMNIHPYNNGHVLIVPYREVDDYIALNQEEKTELSELMERSIGWLKKALDPDGFNIGINLGEASGAGIPEHLHIHVVPRWRGDTNFMPTVADVKIVPEAIADTYRRIKTVIDREAGEIK